MSSVKWLLPNGTVLSHASRHPRISVLNDGTLNFSHVLLSDTGVYTCMVTNVAGNSNASAYLNVSTAELNTSNYSFFTTVTVETTEISPEDTTRKYKPVPTTSTGYQPAYTTSTTVLIQTTRVPKQVAVTATDTNDKMQTSLDEVMKTTKIIIGCFVAITFMAAVMLVAFYKLRKQHQLHKHHGPTRTVEIINVEDELPAASAVSVAAAAAVAGAGGVGGDSHLALPALERDHLNHHHYVAAAFKAHYSSNPSGGGCGGKGPPGLNSIHEPLLFKSGSKENVQETQI